MKKTTYDGNLNYISTKRIKGDRRLIANDKDTYNNQGIYFNFNENVINNTISILIVGSFDKPNPYYGGFYLFNGIYPDNYPFSPPLMKAKTQGDNIRFHPNFYTNGKVCLSILGTWAGPPWSPSQNIGSLSITIRSLFIESPITQEPGWEKCAKIKADMYKRIIGYKNLEIAVYNVVKLSGSSDSIYFPYRTVIEKKFLELYPSYVELIHTYDTYDSKEFLSPIYGMRGYFKPKELLRKFKTLHTELTLQYPAVQVHNSNSNTVMNINSTTIPINITTTEINSTNKSSTIPINITNTKKNHRKSPNDKALIYDVGYIKESENDNKKWIVIETKSGIKRWIRYTPK